MDSYRAEDIIRERRQRSRRTTTVDRRREREIAYYLIFATIPKTALELERLGFPTEGAAYKDVNENLIVPGESRPRTGWYLSTISWSGRNWNLYILQRGVLVMQDIDNLRQVRIVPRERLRRYVARTNDLKDILQRLRSMGNILVSHPLKLGWLDYPGFWFCTF